MTSRFWGFCAGSGDHRASQLVIYFFGFTPLTLLTCSRSPKSLRNLPRKRDSLRMIDSDTNAIWPKRIAGFARWRRIFHVVH